MTEIAAVERAIQAAHTLGLDQDAAHRFVCQHCDIDAAKHDDWREPVALRLGILQAAAANGKHTTAAVEFLSWQQLHEHAPDEPDWLWKGYVARGAITLVAGKPKAGKSTLICAICEAVDAGATRFLDRPIDQGPVIYISEEAGVTLKPKLPPSTRGRVLTRDLAWPRPEWDTMINAAVNEANTISAKLLVIDSYVFWAQLGEGQENDASINQAMIASLVAAANTGLAVILVHHHRKGGGNQGDAVRGSGGIFAAVDALIEVERIDNAPPKQRQLVASGRWPNMAPVTIADYDQPTRSWSVIAEVDSREEAGDLQTRAALLEALPIMGASMSIDDIEEETGMHRLDFHEHLRALVAAGKATVTGKGVKGDPRRYMRAVRAREDSL